MIDREAVRQTDRKTERLGHRDREGGGRGSKERKPTCTPKKSQGN